MDESGNIGSGRASRRAFLAGAGLTGAAVGAGVLAGPAGAEPGVRAHTAGRFALELDGKAAGAPIHAGGGDALGMVVTEEVGPDNIAHKHIGGVKYEDITVSCSTGMSKGFYQWIQNSFDNKRTVHDGKLTSLDSDGDVFDSVNFAAALITEVGFPALDATGKDAAKMTLKFRPESTTRGGTPAAKLGAKAKAWLVANFELKIDGVDCSRVASIDSFTWKQAIVEQPAPGAGKVATGQPTKISIPDLKITTAASRSKDFFDWFDVHVRSGKNLEKSGSLTYRTPSGLDLFTLTFAGLGIWIVDTIPPTVDNIRRVKAELYCEEMSFRFTSAAWA